SESFAHTVTQGGYTYTHKVKEFDFDAYSISGNNYFKLRDLAFTLSGTEKQFEVVWDGEANAIMITSGVAYTPVGGEMGSKGTENKIPTATSSKVYLDGVQVSFTAYNIGSSNYFKLRDIGQALDFGVDWYKGEIIISCGESYTPE
ncbi:MAG: hypothetical protein LBJ99_01875, partial [Oscillospiraceae bacterium]|nr:hypothetical protein [Oscillospiraceae bacterium]